MFAQNTDNARPRDTLFWQQTHKKDPEKFVSTRIIYSGICHDKSI